jgi:hypothetical protein
VLLEGAAVVLLVGAWLAADGAGLAGFVGTAAAIGAGGAARGAGSLFGEVEVLLLATLLEGAFAAVAGLWLAASSTVGRASATAAALSPVGVAVAAGAGVDSATTAGGGVTTATVLSERWRSKSRAPPSTESVIAPKARPK